MTIAQWTQARSGSWPTPLFQRRYRARVVVGVGAADSHDGAVVGLDWIEIVLVVPLLSRMGCSLRCDRSLQDWLPGLDHLAELGLDTRRDAREHFADSPPQVFLNRKAIDCGELLVDVNVSQVRVELAEADGSLSVDEI